jgi:hypothetical protein
MQRGQMQRGRFPLHPRWGRCAAYLKYQETEDLFNKEVVGTAMGSCITKELVIKAMQQAI